MVYDIYPVPERSDWFRVIAPPAYRLEPKKGFEPLACGLPARLRNDWAVVIKLVSSGAGCRTPYNNFVIYGASLNL